MLVIDEGALICDFAETYHIYDYRRLPLRTVAALASGLRDNSRIKMKISGLEVPMDTLMLASIRDYLALLWWTKTEDSRKGQNRPEMITQKLMHHDEQKRDVTSFNSGADFDRAWAEITKKGGE